MVRSLCLEGYDTRRRSWEPCSFAPAFALLRLFWEKCGPGWPAALPGGPCAAVRRGRQAAQRESTGEGMDARVEATQERLPEVDSFSPAHGCAVEKPGPASRTRRAGGPASAKRGALSLWLSFSLSTQRESNSGAGGPRKLLRWIAKGVGRFSQRGALATLHTCQQVPAGISARGVVRSGVASQHPARGRKAIERPKARPRLHDPHRDIHISEYVDEEPA